jgi:hypothetical protein
VNKPPVSASGAAFDHVASRYDVESTRVELSRWIRARVQQRLAVLFRAGDYYWLELGHVESANKVDPVKKSS